MNTGGTKRQRADTVLFVALFLLAGAAHVLDRLTVRSLLAAEAEASSALLAMASTGLFVLNFGLYLGLLIWWLLSVRQRLLPSPGRSYVMLAAAFMIFFLLQRAFKYRLAADGTPLEHVLWYAYYVPLGMIPSLFLLTCLSMEPEREKTVRARRAVWICGLGLVLAVVTNDLHFGMFRPVGDHFQNGAWGSYENGALWYVFYAYVGGAVLLGLVMLARIDRRQHGGRRALPSALLMLLTLGLMYAVDNLIPTYYPKYYYLAPYFFPETFIFGMLGVFESCIRSRLIPCNENYAGFFARLELPAEIDDEALRPVYRTARPVNASQEQKRAALHEPLLLDGGERLYGRLLPSGRAFWVGDERTLRQLNEDLAEAAEVLESENELLRYENEQKEARARVDARNRVYARAAAEVYGTQKKIAALLEGLDAAAPDYRDRLAKILLLNAYVKRKTNFVLLEAERDRVSAEELALALEESARFLALCGVNASVERSAARSFAPREVMALYDSFEALAEMMPGLCSALMVSLTDDSLRLMADGAAPEAWPETPAQLTAEAEGGQLYLSLRCREGGAA